MRLVAERLACRLEIVGLLRYAVAGEIDAVVASAELAQARKPSA